MTKHYAKAEGTASGAKRGGGNAKRGMRKRSAALSEWEKEELREKAQVEAERMEIYEGGPLPDANFFDHDPFCYDGPDEE